MSALKIHNRAARQLWLDAQGLANAPTGALDVMDIIRRLGFVQLDTIQVLARAHHHILWSRNQNYREPMLNKLLAEDRGIFEHFTHDASVLPMEFYPMWRQFRRKKEELNRRAYWQKVTKPDIRPDLLSRIAAEGPLSTHAFDTKIEGKRGMWERPPHKVALDYLWYCGDLATSHREGITKFYDLTENVVPQHLLDTDHSDAHQLDWLCNAALDRMAFGTLTEVKQFWDAMDIREVRDWAKTQPLIPVEVQGADGSWTPAIAPEGIEERLSATPPPTSRLRILNPFDPAIRDRNRLERLFGLEYRIEIFVPAAKRKWGYYVYPLLEGDRFVGRIEAKADRAKGELNILNLWKEPKVKWTAQRAQKLDAELDRMARFIGVQTINWHCPRQP